MQDGILGVVAIVLLFIALPVTILIARDRITRARRDRPDRRLKDAADRVAYERRILSPDWSSVERHLRRAAPRGLRELYADASLVTRRDVRYSADYTLSTFEALDEEAMAAARDWLGFAAVTFASTQDGDAIYLRSGLSEDETVYLTRHDGNETDVLAGTLQEMLDTLRRLNA